MRTIGASELTDLLAVLSKEHDDILAHRTFLQRQEGSPKLTADAAATTNEAQ